MKRVVWAHFGELGLADTGGAREEHGRDGPRRVLEAGACPPHRARHCAHCIRLPNHLLLRDTRSQTFNILAARASGLRFFKIDLT